MDEQIRLSKKTQAVMFTIRIDKSVADFYDDLASKTNRSRNELISMALSYAMDKFNIIDSDDGKKVSG